MKKVLVATEKAFAKAAVEAISKVVAESGNEIVLLENYTDKKQLLEAVANVEAMIIRSDIVDQEVIDHASKLEIVVRAGAGYDNIDLAACTAKNVVAMNTPGQNSNAVAELAAGMMVMAARNFYNGTSGTELKGKTLGLHAFGYVGKALAAIAKGFGMTVYAYDPFLKAEDFETFGVKQVASEAELYKVSQYVSLHIPATEKTKKSINFELLSSMPKNAVLINTARKEVIDEEGLVKMFAERPDFKYVSDVEPGNKAEISEKFAGRYFFTPKKMGAQTSEANNNAGVAAAHQIVKFFASGDKTFQVNK